MDKVNEETLGWQKQKEEKQEKLNDLQKTVNEAKSKVHLQLFLNILIMGILPYYIFT